MDTRQKPRRRSPQPDPRSKNKAAASRKRPVQTKAAAPAKRKRPASSITRNSPVAERSAARAEMRRKQVSRPTAKPKVVYTQPRPFNPNKLLLQLGIVLAVVLAITMGLSVFFKVKNVVVYGNSIYSAWTVREASGIQDGDNLMSFGKTRACGKIKAELPYVDTVRIGINLPDTVNIYIEELEVVYAIRSTDGTWWLMSSSGRVVEQTDSGTAANYTKILGVELTSPMVGEQAVVAQQVQAQAQATQPSEPTGIGGETRPAPVVVTAQNRFDAAMTIVGLLELNDVVGEAASVDVTNLNDIQLWYGVRFQVLLGDTTNMEKKITWMSRAVKQMEDYQMGVLDVTFTTWPDEVGYSPFD